MHRELSSDFGHVLAEQGHPGGAVSLLQVAARGQRCAAVEDADVVQPQEPTFERVVASAVLAVYPPGEVEHQFVKGPLEPFEIALTPATLFKAVREDGRPGRHWRIPIAEL